MRILVVIFVCISNYLCSATYFSDLNSVWYLLKAWHLEIFQAIDI